MIGNLKAYITDESIRAKSLRSAEVILRIGIGMILIYAGLSKARQPHDFLVVVYDYRIVGPPYGRFVAMILPQLEIVVGCFLLIRLALPGAFLAATTLGLILVWVQLTVIWRELSVHCGCFGGGQGDLVGAATLTRAAILTLLAFAGFCLALRQTRRALPH